MTITEAIDRGNRMFEDGACDCSWIGTDAVLECGCGEVHCRLYRDSVIHWQNKHWLIQCAFESAKKEMDKLRKALVILRDNHWGCYQWLEKQKYRGNDLMELDWVARVAGSVLEQEG